MRELLRSPARPVLPPSLHTLRLATGGTLQLSAEGRAGGLTPATIPVLVLEAETLRCNLLNAGRAGAHNPPVEAADLPVGFQALWVRVGCIEVCRSAGYAGGGNYSATSVDVAEELCRFLGAAPKSYRDFRIFAGAVHYFLCIELTSPPIALDIIDCIAGSFDSIGAAAAAMRQWSPKYGLSVSVSDDRTYLQVVRLQTEG